MKLFKMLPLCALLSAPALGGSSYLVAGTTESLFCGTLESIFGTAAQPMEYRNAAPSFPFYELLTQEKQGLSVTTHTFVASCNDKTLEATVRFTLFSSEQGADGEYSQLTYTLEVNRGQWEDTDGPDWILDARVKVENAISSQHEGGEDALTALTNNGLKMTAQLGPNRVSTVFSAIYAPHIPKENMLIGPLCGLHTTYTLSSDSPMVQVYQTRSAPPIDGPINNTQSSAHSSIIIGQPYTLPQL